MSRPLDRPLDRAAARRARAPVARSAGRLAPNVVHDAARLPPAAAGEVAARMERLLREAAG